MNRRSFWIPTSILISILILTTAHSQEYMTFVDNSVFPNPQREPAVFRHDEHNEAAEIEECNECHHVYEDGEKSAYESSEDQFCSDCHELESSGSKPGLLRAYHLNCKGCHTEAAKGPVMCGECHVKNENRQ